MKIHEILSSIQVLLDVPKGQFNSFGNYSYRSCEDILGAVKPLLDETGTFITLTDEIIQIGERYYVQATATISSGDGQFIRATGYAREDESKKGMDLAQLSGSCSSYARKYALGGLLALDDGQDADSDEHKASEIQQATFHTLVDAGDGLGLYLFRKRVGDDLYINLYNSFPAGKKVSGKKIANELEHQGQDLLANVNMGLEDGDDLMVAENIEGISSMGLKVLCSIVTPEQRETLMKAHKQNKEDEANG